MGQNRFDDLQELLTQANDAEASFGVVAKARRGEFLPLLQVILSCGLHDPSRRVLDDARAQIAAVVSAMTDGDMDGFVAITPDKRKAVYDDIRRLSGMSDDVYDKFDMLEKSHLATPYPPEHIPRRHGELMEAVEEIDGLIPLGFASDYAVLDDYMLKGRMKDMGDGYNHTNEQVVERLRQAAADRRGEVRTYGATDQDEWGLLTMRDREFVDMARARWMKKEIVWSRRRWEEEWAKEWMKGAIEAYNRKWEFYHGYLDDRKEIRGYLPNGMVYDKRTSWHTKGYGERDAWDEYFRLNGQAKNVAMNAAKDALVKAQMDAAWKIAEPREMKKLEVRWWESSHPARYRVSDHSEADRRLDSECSFHGGDRQVLSSRRFKDRSAEGFTLIGAVKDKGANVVAIYVARNGVVYADCFARYSRAQNEGVRDALLRVVAMPYSPVHGDFTNGDDVL